MKKIILLIIIVFSFSSSIVAQPPLNFDFNQRVDIYDGFSDIGTQSLYWNSGILNLGYCYSSHFGTTISFYDTLGNLNWKDTLFYSQNYFVGYQIIAINNSSFYLAGIVWNDTITQYDIFLAKYNTNGDSIYYKVYPETGANIFTAIQMFSPDTFLLLSYWQAQVNIDTSNIVISKIDTSGNIITTLTDIPDMKKGYGILKAGNNKIYVGGTLKTNLGTNYHVKAFINVFDYDLNLITRTYPSLALNERFKAFNLWNNNLYLTTDATDFFYPPNPNATPKSRIGKMDSLGNYIHYSDFGYFCFTCGSGTPKVLNENCLILPIIYSPDSLFFIDSTLNLICKTNVDLPNATCSMSSNFDILPSKKLVGTGYFSQDATHSNDHWIFLTENIEEYLNTNCNMMSVIENEIHDHSYYLIYPTPFNEFLIVRNQKYSSKLFNVSLINNLGENIISKTGVYEEKLNTTFLKEGIYFLRITDSEQVNVFKTIKLN